MHRLLGLAMLAVVGLLVWGCAGSSGGQAATPPHAEAMTQPESPPEDALEAEEKPSGPVTGPTSFPGQPNGGVSRAGTPIQSKVVALDFGTVDVKPTVLHAAPPAYPRTAREARVEGTVVVRIEIDTEGNPQKVTVRRSVLMLDDAATEAAWNWRFTPALRDGQPIPVRVEVPFDFKLR